MMFRSIVTESVVSTKPQMSVLALKLNTGEIAWSQQVTPGDTFNNSCVDKGTNCRDTAAPDFDFGSSALLVAAGGREFLIAGQKSGIVYALDPDQKGKIVWQTRVGRGGSRGVVQWGDGK